MFTLDDIKKSACAKRNPHLFTEKEKKKPKYGNKKVEIDGLIFDSKKEGNRYRELKIMLAAGIIINLVRQVTYKLEVNGKLVCKYISDFEYAIVETGEHIVEDVKSNYTRKLPLYRLKKKLMKEIFGIEIKEVLIPRR